MEKTIVAATGNQNKLKEFRQILKGWNVISAKEAGFFGDVEETEETFLGNSTLKAKAICKATGFPSLADDSGLCVEALGGAPGVYSARYSGGGDKENRALLLKNLQGVENRKAYFASAIVLAFPDGTLITAEGRTYGTILDHEQGEGGFGYDCLFMSDDLNKSFGDATPEEKNAVSHRGRALRELESKL